MSLQASWQRLRRYWHIEVIGGEHKPFSWWRLRQKCKRSNRYAYVFWFRIAYVMHESSSEFWRRRARLLNERLSRRYNVEIMPGAKIGEGLWIGHPSGIVISGHARIGKNFKIWQSCTIGIIGKEREKSIRIGDNVRLAAHSCVIGDNIDIGDNVSFGAMSFVNKSVMGNCVYTTEKTSRVCPIDG